MMNFTVSRKILIPFVVVFGLISLNFAEYDGKWRLAKHKNGIKVFTRKSNNSAMDDSRATVIINATVSKVLKEVTDVPNHVEWMDRVKVSTLLKRTSDKDFIAYYEAQAPWPVANRDIISHFKIREESSGKVVIHVNGEPDFIPRKENIVRIQNVVSNWEIIPLPNNRVEVVYMTHSDPGGSIPLWMVNASATDNPYNTLKNLRDRLNPAD